MAVNVQVKYRYCKTTGSWVNSSASIRMENPNPSESMIRQKILSMYGHFQDVEIIDYKVG